MADLAGGIRTVIRTAETMPRALNARSNRTTVDEKKKKKKKKKEKERKAARYVPGSNGIQRVAVKSRRQARAR